MDEIRLKDMQILEFGTIILPQVVKNKKDNNNKKKLLSKFSSVGVYAIEIWCTNWNVNGTPKIPTKNFIDGCNGKALPKSKMVKVFFSSFLRLRSWICIVIRNISKININHSISHRLIFLWIKFKFDYE